MPGVFATRLDLLQELQRVVDLAGIPRRDLLTLAEVCADGEEDRIEPAFGLLRQKIGDFVVQDDLDADSADAFDLAVQHFRGRRYLGMPKCIMPPAIGPASWMTTVVSAERQVPGGRETARSSANDEHPLVRWRFIGCDGPFLL